MKSVSVFAIMAVAVVSGCGLETAESANGDEGIGSTSQEVEEGIRLKMIGDLGKDDVRAMKVEVFHLAEHVVSDCVPLEDETLPASFLPAGSGDDHRFADKFFVLAPSKDPYDIVVTPVKSCSPEEVSEDCEQAVGEAIVEPNKTTEVTLVSQCDMEDTGGLDVIGALNHDPVIEGLIYNESKFMLTCENLSLEVVARDQDGDELTYEWLIEGPPGAQFETDGSDWSTTMFTPKTPGTYNGKVTVCDNFGLCADLAFPIHVQMSVDADDNGVGDECQGKKVAILSPTVTGGLGSVEAMHYLADGHQVDIIEPRDWEDMSAAEFSAYDALVLGDPKCSTSAGDLSAAAADPDWATAATGNVVIIGADPTYHYSSEVGARELVANGLDYALASSATGAYVTLSCYYHFAAANTPVPALDGFGNFTVIGAASIGTLNNVHISDAHPAFPGISDSNLSGWGNSVHEPFGILPDSWPVDFKVMAMAVHASGNYAAPDGTIGYPYILYRDE